MGQLGGCLKILTRIHGWLAGKEPTNAGYTVSVSNVLYTVAIYVEELLMQSLLAALDRRVRVNR